MCADLAFRAFGRRSLRRLRGAAEHTLLDQAMRVFRLSTEITALEDPAAIPQRVVQALVEELGLPVASVVLEYPASGQLVYAADRGVPDAVKRMGFRSSGIAMTVLRSGEPNFVEDMGRNAAANPEARQHFQAYACLPIRNRERTFGLIFVNYGEAHTFTLAERNILMTFANQTAIALDNARLRKSEQRRSAALAALANLGRDLARSLDLDDLVRVLERTLREQLPGLRSGAFWVQQDQGLHLQVLFGFGRQLLQPCTQLRPDSPFLAQAESGGPGFFAAKALLDALELPLETLPKSFESSLTLALPLQTTEGLEGLIGLVLDPGTPSLGEAELDFLSTLADRAALALHNARLYASSRNAAERDGLTQVLNHTTFLQHMTEALEGCARREQPLALLMLDADHFKRCNDQYGHPFGDRVLMALAAVIRAQVRPTDGVGRLGGEEFGVFLPGADGEMALQVAERIRFAMAALRLDLPDGGSIAAPTVSLGVAQMPNHALDCAGLILRADEALYRAKAGGRNRSCLA